MLFHSAVVKLTLSYVLIVMTISLVFSVVLYRISSAEIDTGLARQSRVFQRLRPDDSMPAPLQDLENARLDQLSQSNHHLVVNLVYFNLLILSLSAGLSYWLARRTMKPIEEMVDEQNRFTADASHELRTPLTAMKTEIEVGLRDQQIDEKTARELLESNLEEIGKLEILSSSLLKLARMEKANSTEFSQIKIKEIILDAYKKVEAHSKKKLIDFEFNCDESIIKGDSNRLKELFIILFDNAIKYSPPHSKIVVNSQKTDHHIEIKVKDQGIGIKASDIPYIFNRFYRADQSRSKDKADGYGLGLSIAKNIVNQHKGKIEVESKPNKGSTFKIKLPL